ncbi:MAG: LysM peptidoglycan-binding domain-containing protein [Lachnospiraceae bacterium]|nr:LysM peptidoglycan-binding domain-containing protein [Lachnospiraceae bacterium]
MKEAPKNIRQIGGIDTNHKVYVEDYVITYMRVLGDNLLKEKDDSYAAVVLLGSKNMSGHNVETYINGVVRIEGFTLWGDASFTNEMWSAIYDKVKTYYEDEEIVGWMFAGGGEIPEEKNRLSVFVNIHKTNFVGKNMLFIEYNCEEKEEKVYDYINGSFIERKGFYVFYQKNETMLNYMVAMNEEKIVECETDSVVKDIRETINNRSEEIENKKLVRSIYATGMLVAAVALLIGSTAIYKTNQRPVTGELGSNQTAYTENDLSGNDAQSVLSNSDNIINAGNVINSDSNSNSAVGTGSALGIMNDEKDGTGNSKDSNSSSTKIDSETDDIGDDETMETTQDTEVTQNAEVTQTMGGTQTGGKSYTFYTVKSGDSLGKISERIWGDIEYVDVLMELNNIDNPDKIYEGQKLWLPNQ